MKIELNNNKVYLDNHGVKKEIHPFWLRERVNGDKFVDIRTKQRLFDPTQIQENIKINDINLSKDFLEVTFNDGASTKLSVQKLIEEFLTSFLIELLMNAPPPRAITMLFFSSSSRVIFFSTFLK